MRNEPADAGRLKVPCAALGCSRDLCRSFISSVCETNTKIQRRGGAAGGPSSPLAEGVGPERGGWRCLCSPANSQPSAPPRSRLTSGANITKPALQDWFSE